MRRIFCISIVTFIALIINLHIGHSQPNLPKSQADSLWNVWQDENQTDTVRLKAMQHYAFGYLFTKPDSAFYFAGLQNELAKEIGLKKQLGNALNTQGVALYFQSEHAKAIDYYKRSLEIRQEINDKRGIAGTLGNIGMINHDQGNYAKAIDYFTQSLKIFEELGDKKRIASSLNNIGVIYKDQGNYSKAIDYYTRSLKAKEEIEDKQGMANTLNNIGLIYEEQGDHTKAIDHHARSLEIREDIGDKIGMSGSLVNIGIIYQNQNNYTKALEYYTRSLKIADEIGNKRGKINPLNNMGSLFYNQKEYKKALDHSTKALLIAKQVGSAIEIRDVAQMLWQINKELGRHKEALEMHELYITTRDSIKSEENQKEIIRQEYKYEYEKQAALDSVEHAKQQQLASATIAQQKAEAEKKDAEIRAKRNQQYALFGGLALLVIFGVFMYNRFRVTRKQKNIIEKQKSEVEQQKEVIEEAHKEITDSIQYAKRIQNAILPPQKIVQEYLPESFILYKPKDVVAGDFYWLESYAEASNSEGTEDLILFAACDCTGHGVPGAMVSVVCNNGLNRSVREHGLTEPGAILNKTREIVIKEFEKSEEEVKDGMDVALCSLSLSTLSLHFAGANNPLWIIRKGASEVEEIKGNKMPIGKYAKETSFDTHEVSLQKGDSIYIFSDGFVDQFGGEKGKKFKPANFKKLLLSIQQEPMERQRELIDEAFEKWRGDLEQLDDVCVLGVRL